MVLDLVEQLSRLADELERAGQHGCLAGPILNRQATRRLHLQARHARELGVWPKLADPADEFSGMLVPALLGGGDKHP